MEPLPPISKVFALVVRKERQRGINHSIFLPYLTSSSVSTGSFDIVAFVSPQTRLDQRHGYLPNYKNVSRSNQSFARVNQTGGMNDGNTSVEADHNLGHHTPGQWNQLIALLGLTNSPSQGHVLVDNLGSHNSQSTPALISKLSGIMYSLSSYQLSKFNWILDSGVTHHVCCNPFFICFH